MKAGQNPETTGSNGFTLVDLLVVVGVVALLIVIQLPALAANKSQSKIAVCADHVRQLDLACQIYANENNSLLPTPGGTWPYDLSYDAANDFLKTGIQTNTFYCPGTYPRFTDYDNWQAPSPYSLWNFPGFHITGYAFAFSGRTTLSSTNQNTMILPETATDNNSGIVMPPAKTAERVLVADATISLGAIQPGYLHPQNNYTFVTGGFYKAQFSPHLNGIIPLGGNLGFKDGHVDWRKFELMVPRTAIGSSSFTFWW